MSTVLAAGLLTAFSGCYWNQNDQPISQPRQHQTAARVTPKPNAYTPPVVKEGQPKGPLRQPKVNTLVRGGDFLAAESRSPKRSAVQRNDLTNRAGIAYRQALSVDPKYLPAYQGLAKLAIDQNKYPEAIQTYGQALEIDPNSAVLWFEKGMCELRARQWEPALVSLRRSVDIDPANDHYVNTLGYALARVGKYDDSYICFCRVNDEATAHFKLARMLQHRKVDELAMQHLNLALQSNPSHEGVKQLIAKIQNGSANQPAAPSQPEFRRVEHQVPPQPTPAQPTTPATTESNLPPLPKETQGLLGDAVEGIPTTPLPVEEPMPLTMEVVETAKPTSPDEGVRPVVLPPPPNIPVKYDESKKEME